VEKGKGLSVREKQNRKAGIRQESEFIYRREPEERQTEFIRILNLEF
jgi:hypothetical protein